jgi:hypothetical protein
MLIMYYVTMTDKHMSGWGHAEGKINKLIFECETLKDAHTVYDNAEHQGSMKYINICSNKPYYSSSRYYPQTKTKDDYSAWYKEGFFRNK